MIGELRCGTSPPPGRVARLIIPGTILAGRAGA
jgi:hypothetical protein